MGRKIIEHLGLLTDPDFNPHYKKVMRSAALSEQEQQDSQYKAFSLENSDLKTVPTSVTEEQISQAVTRFLSALKVRTMPGSNAIEIEYQSTNPNKAALIANSVADLYIEQRLETKFKATRKLTDWLDRRLGELRDQVRISEEAVQKYKELHNITEGTRAIVSTEQLSQLNAELIKTKSRAR